VPSAKRDETVAPLEVPRVHGPLSPATGSRWFGLRAERLPSYAARGHLSGDREPPLGAHWEYSVRLSWSVQNGLFWNAFRRR
jgi:hypothetical protein